MELNIDEIPVPGIFEHCVSVKVEGDKGDVPFVGVVSHRCVIIRGRKYVGIDLKSDSLELQMKKVNAKTNLIGPAVRPLVGPDGLRYVVWHPLGGFVLAEDAGAPNGRVDLGHVPVGLEVAEAGEAQVLVVAPSEGGGGDAHGVVGLVAGWHALAGKQLR